MELMLTAGVDEVGRGPLAGPVVAAAVILNPDKPIEGLKDSKQLTLKRREYLFDIILRDAIAYSIKSASVDEIDRMNILQASLLAMKRAIESLAVVPEQVLVDGNKTPEIDLPCEAIIKGDQKIASISAASILAKVTRDCYMVELDTTYPGYGFAQHAGYPTKQHLHALQHLGITKAHRRSYKPIAKLLKKDELVI